MSQREENNEEENAVEEHQEVEATPVEYGEVQEAEPPTSKPPSGGETYSSYYSYGAPEQNQPQKEQRLTVDDDVDIEAKIFVGALSWSTTEQKLRDYFGQYGEVVDATVMQNRATGNPRGFGFVRFRHASTVDEILKHDHYLDDRKVDVKKSLPKNQAPPAIGKEVPSNGPPSGPTDPYKIFVGALPQDLDDEGMRQYFSKYGNVEDCVVMRDKNTNKSRGFGFVTFSNSAAVDKTLSEPHTIFGRQVDVKKAHPKGSNDNYGGRGGGGGGRGGGPPRGPPGGYGMPPYGGYDPSGQMPMPMGMMGGYPPYGPPMDPAMAYYGYGADPAADYGMYGGYEGYYGAAAYGADYMYGGDYGGPPPPMGGGMGPPPHGGGRDGGGYGNSRGGGPYRNPRSKRGQRPY